MRRALLSALFFVVTIGGAGCGTPVGVKRVDPETVHRMLTRSVLSRNELSTPTRNVLYRRGLYEPYEHAAAHAP